jgi:hypothetical protein
MLPPVVGSVEEEIHVSRLGGARRTRRTLDDKFRQGPGVSPNATVGP